MKGRPAKPTALKLVTGNPGKRPLKKGEPKPKVEIPERPDHLDEYGRRTWDRLAPMLYRIRVLTESDWVALERLCDCYSDVMQARKLIARDGRTYESISPDGQRLIKGNPAVTQLRAADSMLKSLLVEFGLTPAARSKVTADQDGEEKADPIAQYFA